MGAGGGQDPWDWGLTVRLLDAPVVDPRGNAAEIAGLHRSLTAKFDRSLTDRPVGFDWGLTIQFDRVEWWGL